MNLEYLRHGKALCGKVFRRFVETFNFHNDFISNLKGDADLPVVGGKVHLDRTDERHPVIRCRLCGGGGGGGGSTNLLPWSFSCTEDTDSGVRTGGWTNCALQLGYHEILVSPDLVGIGTGTINGTGLTDDGEYYVEVNLKNETAEIKIATDRGSIQDDATQSIIRLWIGTVEDGKLTSGLHYNPVAYKYV